MLTAVLFFALITALFEMFVLFSFVPEKLLAHKWFQGVMHGTMFSVNLWIHFGTITGTMTAVTAGAVSFITVPFVLYVMRFRRHYKERSSV